MPYIRQERRTEVEPILQAMRKADIKYNGDLNYVLFAYALRYVPDSYNQLRNYCAELRACATEIERTILGPYEDTKVVENGRVE